MGHLTGTYQSDHVAESDCSVREIIADFGFSFALTTAAPAFPEQPIVEHPTKRQRTVESPSSKPCKKHTPKRVEEVVHSPKRHNEGESAENVVAQVETLPAQEVPQEVKTTLIEAPTFVQPVKNPKGSKAPSKTRRKLQLDDELEVLPKSRKKKARQSGGLEDTFIFGLKPKKRQPKSKLKEPIEEEPTHGETENVPAPPKRKRTAKSKQQANDEPCEKNAAELNEEVVALAGKPQKRKGKPASRKRDEALHVDINPLEEERPPITTGNGPGKEDPPTSLQAETEQPQPASKPTKPKATAKKAAKRTIEEATENETTTEPEPTAKRPRRQAATSAMAKVALGYEEDLVPVDKLRRAPEPVAKRGRPKKTTAAEVVPVLLPSPPQSVSKPSAEDKKNCGVDGVPVAKARGRPRKLGVKIAKVGVMATEKEEVVATSSRTEVKTSAGEDTHDVAETETPVEKAPPVKRARKVRAQAVAQDSLMDDEPAEEVDEVVQKRSRVSKVSQPKTSRKAASKAAKPAGVIDENVAVIEDVSAPAEIVIPETQESHDTMNNYDCPAGDQTKRSHSGTTEDPKRKMRRALAESDVNIVRSLPPDDSGVIVKPTTTKPDQFDETSTKPASKDKDPLEMQSSRKTKLLPAINPTVEHGDHNHGTDPTPVSAVEVIPTKRARKAQHAQPSKSKPAIEPPHDEAITPRKRHVIAADEDLDWLFEKSENKRSRAPARNPRASSKANRQAPGKKTSADAKDMDLDDLLESIAGFSGKLLTGKGGRAMASRQ